VNLRPRLAAALPTLTFLLCALVLAVPAHAQGSRLTAPDADPALTALARQLPVPPGAARRAMARCDRSDQKFAGDGVAPIANGRFESVFRNSDVLVAWGQLHFGDRAYCFIPMAEGAMWRKPDWRLLFTEWQRTLQAQTTGELSLPQAEALATAVKQAAAEAKAAAAQAPAAAPAAQQPAQAAVPAPWTLKSDAAQRSVFGAIELGAPLGLRSCDGGRPPCAVPMGKYEEYTEFGLTVQFVYLNDIPQWVRPMPFKTGLADCSQALPSRQPACIQERAQQAARTPPPPHLVVATYGAGQHVVDVFFIGAAGLCEVGFKAFESKYGKPGFVNAAGTNADWTFDEYGASVACNVTFSPTPLRWLLGTTAQPHSHYRITLREAFRHFSEVQRDKRQRELDRAGKTGPKL